MTMDTYREPLPTPRNRAEMMTLAREWLHQGHRVAIAVVISTWGSAPSPAGSMLLIRDDGHFEGAVSGGCVEGDVIVAAEEVLAGRAGCLLEFGVTSEVAWSTGLACGGTIRIWLDDAARHIAAIETMANHAIEGHPAIWALPLDFTGSHVLGQNRTALDGADYADDVTKALKEDRSFEVSTADRQWFFNMIGPGIKIVIVGAVHIAQHLARLGRQLGLGVQIIDPRGAFALQDRFQDVTLTDGWPDDVLEADPPDERTAVVTLTHDPKLDDAALKVALRTPAFYIGCLGSAKTQAARLARLKDAGFDDETLARIHGPVGLDLGGRSAAEVALSILAEITAVRHGKGGRNRNA